MHLQFSKYDIIVKTLEPRLNIYSGNNTLTIHCQICHNRPRNGYQRIMHRMRHIQFPNTNRDKRKCHQTCEKIWFNISNVNVGNIIIAKQAHFSSLNKHNIFRRSCSCRNASMGITLQSENELWTPHGAFRHENLILNCCNLNSASRLLFLSICGGSLSQLRLSKRSFVEFSIICNFSHFLRTMCFAKSKKQTF